MGDVIQKAMNYLQQEDILDVAYTYAIEHYELLVIAAAVVFIIVLSLWTMLERMQKRGWVALVPFYRFVVLFKAVGLSPWLALLLIVPGINLIMRVIFYVYVARKFSRSYLLVPCLTVMPLVFLPIVAFGDGQCPHVKVERRKREKKVRKNKRTTVEIMLPTEFEDSAKEKRSVTVTPQKSDEIKPETEPKKTISEVRVVKIHDVALSMAELKIQRQEAKNVKEKRKTAVAAKSAEPKLKYEEMKPQIPKADRMPTMGQGAISRNLAVQKEKAKEVQTSEYDRLLRKQQEAQKKRQERKPQQRKTPAVDVVAKRRKKPEKPAQKPKMAGNQVKVEFKE